MAAGTPGADDRRPHDAAPRGRGGQDLLDQVPEPGGVGAVVGAEAHDDDRWQAVAPRRLRFGGISMVPPFSQVTPSANGPAEQARLARSVFVQLQERETAPVAIVIRACSVRAGTPPGRAGR